MSLPQIEFKLRYWGVLRKYILILAAIVVIATRFPNDRKMTSSEYYGAIFLGLMTMLFIIRDFRRYQAFVFGKPVLAVNEEFIYDRIRDVKFYWKDIEEIAVCKGRWSSQLEIELEDPEFYLNQLTKDRKPRKGDKDYLFVIDLSFVKVKPDELKIILQKYSDSPEDREQAIDANAEAG